MTSEKAANNSDEGRQGVLIEFPTTPSTRSKLRLVGPGSGLSPPASVVEPAIGFDHLAGYVGNESCQVFHEYQFRRSLRPAHNAPVKTLPTDPALDLSTTRFRPTARIIPLVLMRTPAWLRGWIVPGGSRTRDGDRGSAGTFGPSSLRQFLYRRRRFAVGLINSSPPQPELPDRTPPLEPIAIRSCTRTSHFLHGGD
jgi:hypothetical protein